MSKLFLAVCLFLLVDNTLFNVLLVRTYEVLCMYWGPRMSNGLYVFVTTPVSYCFVELHLQRGLMRKPIRPI